MPLSAENAGDDSFLLSACKPVDVIVLIAFFAFTSAFYNTGSTKLRVFWQRRLMVMTTLTKRLFSNKKWRDNIRTHTKWISLHPHFLAVKFRKVNQLATPK